MEHLLVCNFIFFNIRRLTVLIYSASVFYFLFTPMIYLNLLHVAFKADIDTLSSQTFASYQTV